MLIRKLFKTETAHVVRNCSSERCKYSIHGHSAKIEVFLESDTLDNAGMVVDFGLLKSEVKSFIDSFDHCYVVCSKDRDDFKQFIKDNSARFIEMPFSPSAEILSCTMFIFINRILENTKWANGEGNVKLYSVRYHETDTGYAEFFRSDYEKMKFSKDKKLEDEFIKNVIFSDDIKADWKTDIVNDILNHKKFIKPKINLQIVPQNLDI